MRTPVNSEQSHQNFQLVGSTVSESTVLAFTLVVYKSDLVSEQAVAQKKYHYPVKQLLFLYS
jgi:hypothetical protein